MAQTLARGALATWADARMLQNARKKGGPQRARILRRRAQVTGQRPQCHNAWLSNVMNQSGTFKMDAQTHFQMRVFNMMDAQKQFEIFVFYGTEAQKHFKMRVFYEMDAQKHFQIPVFYKTDAQKHFKINLFYKMDTQKHFRMHAF